jgi:cell division protein FtsQ
MSIKGNIRKIIFIGLWAVIGSGVLVLLIAAIKSRNDKTCKGIAIQVNGQKSGKWLLNRNDIINQLTSNGSRKVKGEALQNFDLKNLEEKLEKHVWIKDAELFFDNNEVLQVRLVERQPLARLFTKTGSSFYLDQDGKRLPLSERITLKLPVFTGFPSDKSKLKLSDSLLLQHVKELSKYISQNPFWMAQIAQVDITASRNFEMVPTVGNHIIEFGPALDYEKKFKKLLIFYDQILSKTGMNKYERINVQYNQQVIGIRKAMMISKADSLKAVKNIQQMIESAQEMQQAAADSIPDNYPTEQVQEHLYNNPGTDSNQNKKKSGSGTDIKSKKKKSSL